jgi:hypothetical protein
MASEKIKLVQGDNRPYIKLTLKDADGVPMNLTAATVRVYFRAAGTTTILSTLPCTLIGDGSLGQCQFNFPGSTLDVEPGGYEGEVEVDFGGEIQTVYDILRFQVRPQFD